MFELKYHNGYEVTTIDVIADRCDIIDDDVFFYKDLNGTKKVFYTPKSRVISIAKHDD